MRVLLLDADGNLFPSEEPAFVASADVTNRFLASLHIDRRYSAEYLLATATGRNFRTTAVTLATAHGVPVEQAQGAGPEGGAPEVTAPGGAAPGGADDGKEAGAGVTLGLDALDAWVAEERKVVTAYLGRVLRPDPAVLGPLRRLATRYELAAVSSSALSRLDTCFRATGLVDLLPVDRRFSAEDSLPHPTSKPDPAVYLLAVERLGVAPQHAVAVEDSLPGVRSAVAAGIPTVGNLMFVAPVERAARRAAFAEAGVTNVIDSWAQLAADLLDGTTVGAP